MSARPRTILFANHSGRISGAEQSLLVLLRVLADGPYRTVCAGPPTGPFQEAVSEIGCRTVGAPFRRLYKTRNPLSLCGEAAHQAWVVRSLCKAIRRTQPDLLHSNSTTAHLAGAIAAKAMRIPSVWHVRDVVPLGALGYLLGRMSDRIVAISHAVARTVRRYASASQIDVVYNGIDARAFAASARPGALRAELGLPPSAALVGMVGQLVPWKGHRVFLEAMSRIAGSVRHANGILVGSDLFGDHPEYVAELHALPRTMGLSDSVHILGYRRDVATVMADIDVLMVPSVNEPFGRVALEAMSLRKPVVASDSGGLPEIVVNEVTGRICPTGDAAAFGDAVVELLTNGRLAVQYGVAGRGRVTTVFSADRMAQSMARIYEELASAHRH